MGRRSRWTAASCSGRRDLSRQLGRRGPGGGGGLVLRGGLLLLGPEPFQPAGLGEVFFAAGRSSAAVAASLAPGT